ncbi:MAG: hypothetical protein C0594_04050 [Marinilabiliales bacterium]|nr:MAG: hypothetical protein C0594_04050 [Marinilabiliales bacterium]
MEVQKSVHTFHIPVMGIGFTIDTPVRVAKYGISSVISLADDLLMEKMRAFYSQKHGLAFHPIPNMEKDHRAKRITAYLNLINKLVQDSFQSLKESVGNEKGELSYYLELLPDTSEIKTQFHSKLKSSNLQNAHKSILDKLKPGAIDVNIMTLLDKPNYLNKELLPDIYNDAHAALRGYSKSDLESSLILSAGINTKLYSYLAEFDCFYPDENWNFTKRIILKVADYKSAFIQGKYLARKGLWVSEFRIESGLNCGGHAFISDGSLLGPVLEEFKAEKENLMKELYSDYVAALKQRNKPQPSSPGTIHITVQGGVGSAQEHKFLLNHYKLDSIGWGSPFLLVPEVANIDPYTLDLLQKAGESELETSRISPINKPFNSLKSNTKDIEKLKRIKQGNPGSNCPKGILAFNKEFTEKAICTASREYQSAKIKEIKSLDLTPEEKAKKINEITVKSCICVGLGTSALLVNGLDTQIEGEGVSVCPGPNLAYFTDTSTLAITVDHIYGRKNILKRKDRPHVFIKELELNIDFLTQEVKENKSSDLRDFSLYHKRLSEGIRYYKELFSENLTLDSKANLDALHKLEDKLKELKKYN